MGVFLCLDIVFFYVSHVISASEIKTPPFEYPELPRLYIELNGTTLEEINSGSKDIRYKNNTATFLVDKEYYDFKNVEIKGRGNSTWWEGSKKPYQIKFESKENLFGLGKAKSWVLLANYFDEAYLRNDVAFHIARLIGADYANDGRFLELYIDNEYVGLYYLTQKINISSASVKIKDENAVLMELDNVYYEEDGEYYLTKNKGDAFVLKDSVSDDESVRQMAAKNFVSDFSALEEAIDRKDWGKIQELIDVESFAEYYILQDFSLNWDSFTTSTYFYKNGPHDKIHAGPAWDFDNAFGRWLETMFYRRNIEYKNDEDKKQSLTFFELTKVSEFRRLLVRIVKERLLPYRDEILTYLSTNAERIRNSAIRDNEKLGRNNYDDEVEKMRKAIEKRFDYYSIYYANEDQLADGVYLFKNINTEFKIEKLEDDNYRIIRVSDNKVLSVDDDYEEYGTVSFHSWKDTIWQKWYICRDNDGKYYLFSVATESVLTLDENGTLRTKPLTRSESEQFEIAEIGTFPLDTYSPKN